MESNLYKLCRRSGGARGIVALPETLGEAIDELAESDLVRRALGDHIFDNYVKLKRQEWDEYRVQLTPWELEKYPTRLVGAGAEALDRSRCRRFS